MNYLAHAYLAGTDTNAIAGALLGDFVKGARLEHYPPAVRDAILLHRAIDRYTDHHTIVISSRGLISAERRRFAGIMLDVFFDHFLARHWPRFGREPLGMFTARVYAALTRYAPTAPERFRRMLPHMLANDWLANYAEQEVIDATIDGISRRLKRANTLAGGGEELRRRYDAFEASFMAFFPELVRYVELTRTGEPRAA